VNLKELRKYCIYGGLINNRIRKIAWPLLLDIDESDIEDDHVKYIYEHKDYNQVARDIERSLWKFTAGQEKYRNIKRAELSRIINSILSRNPEIHYFQGYHDIASVFIMIFKERIAHAMLRKLSLYHIRDFHSETMNSITTLLLKIVPFFKIIDKEVYQFFLAANTEPFYALSWVLTWFSHVIDHLPTITRLFDFFLATHPLMCFYLSIALIESKREEILSCHCEFSAVHKYFTTFLSEETIDFEYLIKLSITYFEKYPPNRQDLTLTTGPEMPPYPFTWMKDKKYINNFKPLIPYHTNGTKEKVKDYTYQFSFFIFLISWFSLFIMIY